MNDAAVSLHPLDWVVLAGYFAVIVTVGLCFAKFTRSTKDFFFAGQRFAWWLVGISCVATLVGSYSFIQYSQIGYRFGLGSATAYTNEWFVLPLMLLVWLPIVYYARTQSIPEYFERRFDRRTRMLVLVLLLVYLEGYVAINLLTIGVAMNGIFGWNVILSATVMAVVSGLSLHAGGQTSVIMTDLLQGLLLLAVGIGVFVLGIYHLGGFGSFWSGLPEAHRLPFAHFNEDPEFHSAGTFWGDTVTATFAFYFINQGVLMRFLSAKSVRDGRRAMLLVVFVLMPLAAIAVCGAGWVGRAMVSADLLQPEGETFAQDVFVTVARFVCGPGVFGLVIAAMIAALMSTLDTLLSAVSAVAVNDIWRVVRPGRDDAHYLRAARRAAIGATVLGLALIPLFQRFGTIYQALSHFTAMITPPLLTVILMGILWKRFTNRAAFWTLLVGSAGILLTVFFPQLITPLAHGVDPSEGFSYMRSLFGLVLSAVAGVVFTLLDSTPPRKDVEGLTAASLEDGAALFKGGKPNHRGAGRSAVLPVRATKSTSATAHLPRKVMEDLHVDEGDLLYLSDVRWWLGGFRALHVKAGAPSGSKDALEVAGSVLEDGNMLPDRRVRVEKIM
jgi:SSS family solute:Na+ symporter